MWNHGVRATPTACWKRFAPRCAKSKHPSLNIESLMEVTQAPTPKGGEKNTLGFETLTLAPIDRALIDPALLTAEERDWLNAYHVRVRETLTPLVESETAEWLGTVTAAIQ